MRAIQHLSDSFFDFIENTRLGAGLFRVAKMGFFALVILVVGRFASHQFLALRLDEILFISVTAVVFLVILSRPELGIVLTLATTSFIFYYDYLPTLSLYHFIPEISLLEPLRLLLGQGIMIFLLVALATSHETSTIRQRLSTPLTPTLLLFMLIIVLASMTGMAFHGVSVPMMVQASRAFSFYGMFFVTLLCVRGRSEFRVLLACLYIMAVIVAILMLAQFAVGERARLFLGSNIRIESFGGHAGRILPPGSDLVWLVIPFVMTRVAIASGRKRRLLIGSLVVLFGGLLFTFTRAVWFGTLIAVVVMLSIGEREIRRGLLRMLLIMGLCVGVMLVILSLFTTERGSYLTPYIERFTSVFQSKSYEESSSAGARWQEIQAAWPRVVANPWLGIGIGSAYMYKETWDDPNQTFYWQAVSYMHNGYVLVLTNAGFLGLGTCLIMYITFFWRAGRILRTLPDPADRGLVLAAIGAITAIMVAAMMQPTLAGSHDVPMIAVIFGLVELIRYFRSRELTEREDIVRRSVVLSRRRGIPIRTGGSERAGSDRGRLLDLPRGDLASRSPGAGA